MLDKNSIFRYNSDPEFLVKEYPSMKQQARNTKILKLLLILGVMLAVHFPSYANAVPRVGDQAPNFQIKDINKELVDLQSLEGKIVVMEWHNPECPFVRKHYNTKNMQNLQKKYAGNEIVWLTINSSAEGKQGNVTGDQAREYLDANLAVPTHYLLDTSGKIGKLFGARTTPQIIILDKLGKVSYQGAVDNQDSTREESVANSKNYIDEALSTLLQGKQPKVAFTEPYGCSVKYKS